MRPSELCLRSIDYKENTLWVWHIVLCPALQEGQGSQLPELCGGILAVIEISQETQVWDAGSGD